ncbi:DUF6362 family protein [Zavarzinia sp. CC-PAN008]|uniref:DUF6362 family protein n=1 Tax=Zavarzinia sp. CC-PAN008 TaxID=3243332 RepID=UPI003F742B57
MWTGQDVADWLAEAADTLARLPDPDGAWRRRMHAAWPDIVQAPALAQASRSGRTRPGPPSAAAIDRLDKVIAWLSWLDPAQRRIAWALASGISASRLRAMIGCHRNTIANRHAAALQRIAGRLNAEARPSPVATPRGQPFPAFARKGDDHPT